MEIKPSHCVVFDDDEVIRVLITYMKIMDRMPEALRGKHFDTMISHPGPDEYRLYLTATDECHCDEKHDEAGNHEAGNPESGLRISAAIMSSEDMPEELKAAISKLFDRGPGINPDDNPEHFGHKPKGDE